MLEILIFRDFTEIRFWSVSRQLGAFPSLLPPRRGLPLRHSARAYHPLASATPRSVRDGVGGYGDPRRGHGGVGDAAVHRFQCVSNTNISIQLAAAKY
jgi:hypothetical protein